MAEVFISYHDEDGMGELAEKIADRLDEVGISCWCARRDMPFGEDFAREIPSQIDSCKVFLVLLDENVYNSDHVENEVGIAFSRRNKQRNLKIIPLEIGNFQRESWIRYYLVHTQSEKFPEKPDEQRLQWLVGRIAKLLPAPSAKIVKRGECGDDVTYTLDENGVLKISGKGSMRNFRLDSEANTINVPWWDERKTISYIEIQDGVTVIGKCAFDSCTELTNVTIPDSVTTIGNHAFSDCTSLTNVTIPKSVNSIERWAFRNCARLRKIAIPDRVTKIEGGTFYSCSQLTSVIVPDSVTYIGKHAFGSTGLTSVSVSQRAKIANKAIPPHVRIERRA